MNYSQLLTGALASMVLGANAADSFPTIEVVGNKFFYSNNGSQFYIRGVAYQADVAATDNTSFVDPLADAETCKRDLEYLTALNTNVLRVYALDADANHDDCMNMFKDAGIYVIADLAEPKLAISTTDPSWDLSLYERYTSVIDMMQGYDNVLGFFAGNEVVTNSTNTNSAPFVKAAIRDSKAYIKAKGYRDIPVGYSANDDAHTRVPSADFFACGDEDVHADFYGINMYEWCGNSNFKESGFQDRTEDFANMTVPVFFSEYGCNAVRPRKFTEIATMFSDEMTDVWSGGIVYMYYEEVNNYGLVSAIDNSSVSTMADYQYYSSEINNVSPSIAHSSEITTSASNIACPATNKYWKAATGLPPTPEQNACDCMSNSLSCIVASDVDEEDYEVLFNYICGVISCNGITANGSKGQYGAYSFCSPKDKLSFVLDLYYKSQDKDSSACDFSGSASLVKASSDASCKSVLAQAGVSGFGTITDAGSATGTTTGTKATSTDGDSTTTKKAKTTDSSSSSATVSSVSSKSKGGADQLAASGFAGVFAVVAALLM